MSLFIGNLSQRVRKEELERVFQRFGRCTVQVKDGYGFAVYGIRAQAETALRQLRGKRICGAILTLSWSNKQPRQLQSFTRDDRTHKMHGGGRGSFVRRDGGQFPDRQRFNGRRDYQFNQRQLDDGGGRRLELDSAEMHAERERLTLDHEGHDGGQSHRDNFRDSAGDSIDLNSLGAGRWDDDGNKGSSDNGMEFERYEPDHESEEKAEGNQIKDSQGDEEIGGVETRTEQIGELGRNYSNSQRDIDSCSMCGSLGHNIQDCPRHDVSGSKIFENSRTRDIQGMEFIEPKPRTQEFSRNRALDEQYRRSGSKDFGSGNPGNINRVVQGGHRLTAHGKELGLKRHIEKEAATSTHQHHGRRAKKSVMSSHKYRYASRSVSTSSKSSSSSASSSFRRSRSRSSSSYSPRLNYKSDQVRSGGTQNARSKQTRSRSNSPVSISLHQPVSSSHPPHKPEIDLNHGPIVDIDSVEIINNDRKADHLGSNGDDNNCSGPTMTPCDASHQYSMPAEESRKKTEHDQTLGVEGGVKLMPGPDTSGSKVSTHHHPPDYSIYPDELSHVLKYYNLERNVEGHDLSTEEYFGCSRLWPWGIIYYRRLKKGAVSVENYAKRLAQNREYGITDKYVRSSSGWGELTLEGC